jgi:FixJ family two-component response regulator
MMMMRPHTNGLDQFNQTVSGSAQPQVARALIADDQTDVLEALRLLLKREGYQILSVTSPAAIMNAIEKNDFDVLLMDLNYARDTTSGQEGLSLLSRIRTIDESLPVVVMTAWGTVQLAVEAMHLGVGDFVQKPWENDRLLAILRTQVERGRHLRKQQRLASVREALSRAMADCIDLRCLAGLAGRSLAATLDSSNIAIFTTAPNDRFFRVTSAQGLNDDLAAAVRFDRQSMLATVLLETGDAIRRIGTLDAEAAESKALAETGCAIIAPIAQTGQLIGFISLGPPNSGADYDDLDVAFLSDVVKLIGGGISNLKWRGQEKDIEEARQIHLGLLPKQMATLEGFDIAGTCTPAFIVGGDYFDTLRFNDRQVALCIADVAGKGMAAALLMSNLQAAVKAFAADTVLPAALCGKVNRVMVGNSPSDRFMTFFYGVVDGERRKLSYSNAGHNPPILMRKDGSYQRLETGGAVLGVFDTGEFEQDEVSLATGDRLVLFTDGVTEAVGAHGEEFGEERLIDLIRCNLALSASGLQTRIIEAVTEFSGGQFSDDVTVMVLAAGQ